MREKKNHVIRKAHQLFVEKGFQATSIQDILDYSGISKGTFYNYFTSKNELLISIFQGVFKKIDQGRSELLIGQDPSNIDVFMKQVELQLKTNRANQLIPLFEEVYFSNDEDLKRYVEHARIRALHWMFGRLVDIFGEDKRPYLLDSAIMLNAIMHNHLRYYALVHGPNTGISQVVRYCVARISAMIAEIAKSGDQLFVPDLLEEWLRDCSGHDNASQRMLQPIIDVLRKSLSPLEKAERAKYAEFLDFLQEELLQSKRPRIFLVQSALEALKSGPFGAKELLKLEQAALQMSTDARDRQ